MKKRVGLINKARKKMKLVRDILPFPVSTKPLEPPPVVEIKLTVTGNGAFPKKVEGYLKQYLRSLEGVELTDSNGQYWIDVICVVDKFKGYNLSYFVAGMFPELKDELFAVLDETEMEMMSDFFDGLCSVFDHRIILGHTDMVEIACEKIVRDFNENFLQQFLSFREAIWNSTE